MNFWDREAELRRWETWAIEEIAMKKYLFEENLTGLNWNERYKYIAILNEYEDLGFWGDLTDLEKLQIAVKCATASYREKLIAYILVKEYECN